MRKLITVILAATILNTAQAQWQALTPTPFGVAMTVGQWLWSNNKNVYFIEVKGQGKTSEEARMNGFRLAVEQALGSVIASETEQRNSRIQRDEVISYAAGFVERYEIVNSMNIGMGYEIQMRVWVQRTNLAERLLVKSKADGKIDGANAAIMMETSEYSKVQGDRLLYTILKDFPERSFDIKIHPVRVEPTSYRGTQVVVPYDISWNKNYVRTLWKARKATMECGWSGCVGDTVTGDLMERELIYSRPHVLVTVTSNMGQIQHQECVAYNSLTNYERADQYFVQPIGIQIDLTMKLRSGLILPISSPDLAQMSKVQVRVVREVDCPNRILIYQKFIDEKIKIK
jgi:hypothetical protein